jgi:hypothetical protein
MDFVQIAKLLPNEIYGNPYAGWPTYRGLPVFADNAAAVSGGLLAGQIYNTSAGALRIVV